MKTQMPQNKNLDALRKSIDKVDDKILNLLEERATYVHDIGVIKNKENSSIYRPLREKEILERLYKQQDKLSKNNIDAIFLEIFSASRSMEATQNIAFLGPEGSFTHQAAQSQFGLSRSYIPSNSIESIFTMVSNKQCKYGVVPIENSSNGIVNDTIDAFKSNNNVFIIAEKIIQIHHSLVSKCQKYEDIKTIYSKDIAFMQCKNFLKNHNLGKDKVEWIESTSTAQAALLASQNENCAAICSIASAKINKIPILFESIEDLAHNQTRFFIISDFENEQTSNDKSSILVSLPNKSGVLFKFLKSFYKANIDLTKIKSHISQGITSFFIEFRGHKKDKKIQKLISKHNKNNEKIKFLGSYIREYDDI